MARLSGSLNAVENGGGRCVKGSQWMSPLIHFLIKQPALCLSHGLYLSARLVLWADVCARERARACIGIWAHAHTPMYTQRTVWKQPPLGWTGIISSRWFMMEMGNVFSRTTWMTSFNRPENKYRPPHRTLALACVVSASQQCVSHTSPTLLLGAPREQSFPSTPNVLVKSVCICVYVYTVNVCWCTSSGGMCVVLERVLLLQANSFPCKAFSWLIHLYCRYFPTSTFGTWFLLWLQQL